jgi:S-adenosylmethionine:tRNA ribosyltransferase-isomerase
METASFEYHLPPERIAQTPVEPRHASRLLDTRDLSDHRFLDLPKLLRAGDLVVVNNTKVRHARLRGTKVETGGAVEMLVLRRLDDETWEAMVRPSRRLRRGTDLRFGDIAAELVDDPVNGIAHVRMKAPVDIEAALTGVGEMPLPPYITTRLDRPERYQTIFADQPGSAAAPTAGLHFTSEVVGALDASGIALASVELQVGLATFRPISAESVEDHQMHRETCRIDAAAAQAVTDCRRRGGRVVAIGTTVVRTLETFGTGDGLVDVGSRDTDLFLAPGSAFNVVDLLVTNFHLPRSSLLVLVEAFMGPRWRAAYATAVERRYRFLSFGDAMLCERAGS